MKPMSKSEFGRLVDELRDERPAWQETYYDPQGDCVEFLISREDYWAERIDNVVTVYYGRETGEIVGCLIKNVRALMAQIKEKMPNFLLIEIKDGRVKLDLLFSATMWAAGERIDVVTYSKLRDAAERSDAEVELTGAV